MRNAQLAVLTGFISLLAAAPSSQAAIIPLLSGSPTANGANFDWNYTASIGADFRVKTGDFFTIYDFGLIQGHTEPAGWTFSSTLLGLNPLLILPNDDPLIQNVTFTYTGASQLVGPQSLGQFTLTIISDQIDTAVPYGAQATRNGGTQDGRFGSDYGVLSGPALPQLGPPIPEPTAVGLLAAATLPGLLRRRRTT
jgi:hypothetical protein